jgi:tRNA-binding protein
MFRQRIFGWLPRRARRKTYGWTGRLKAAAIKPAISLADLEKLDIRVGTVELVEHVAASEKLVRMRVDFGDHKRTILVGMKNERTNPGSELERRQALFVVNLPPRKMAGEESQAMLFDIGYADGLLPALAVPERPMPNGCRAG